MNILITGAKGTIGKVLCNYLKKEHNIILFDLPDDINDINTFLRQTKNLNCVKRIGMVIHLAAMTSRLGGELYPDNYLNTNIIGTYNVARFCLNNKIKLVNFSTSEIYGNIPETDELDEAMDDICDPTNIYGISKLCAEKVVKHYADNYGLKAITVRPFMLYGEGEYPSPYRSAITQFIDNALKGKPLEVHKGTLRSWCYIDDFCEAMSLIIKKYPFNKYTVYNIGKDEPILTEALAGMIIKMTGAKKSLIKLVDPPKAFLSPVKLGNFDKIREELGFEAKVPIEEGLKKTIEWQRSLCNQK